MRIDPTGNPPPIVPSTTPPAAAPRPTEGTADAARTMAEAGEYVPSADLAAWLAAVKQEPEVRADVVATAEAKLQAGALLTTEAAAESARALFESLDTQPPAE